MANPDNFTPTYYNRRKATLTVNNGTVVMTIMYDIWNGNGAQMWTSSESVTLTQEETQTIAAIALRVDAEFETSSGLEQYTPPAE